MSSSYFIKIRDFVLFSIAQIFIFSRIHLFGYATAYVYLIFLLKLPRNTSRNELLLWGFLIGLAADIAGNTPGINAAAATLLALSRNHILESFITKSNVDDFTPGAHTMKWGKYLNYAIISLLLTNTALFLLELFTISYPVTLLIGIVSSTILTMLFVIVAECFTRK